MHRMRQSVIPLYYRSSFLFMFWVYINNLIRSTGAQTVLDSAPDIPPATKSIKNYKKLFG
jgi:hypothetical protein